MHLTYLSGEAVRVCEPRMKKCFEFVSQLFVSQLSHLHDSPSTLSYLIRFIFSHALGGVWCTIPLVSFRISTIEEIAAWVLTFYLCLDLSARVSSCLTSDPPQHRFTIRCDLL